MPAMTWLIPRCLGGGIGAHQHVAPVRVLRIGGPDFLAVDDEVVARRLRARAQRGQIGARVGLGKAPAPDLIGVDNAGQKGGIFALPDLNEKVARAERCSRINAGRDARPAI